MDEDEDEDDMVFRNEATVIEHDLGPDVAAVAPPHPTVCPVGSDMRCGDACVDVELQCP